MEFLVFWLGCSVAIGILASNRGRSGFGWFLFSIFLSPLLGLIFVLVTRNLRVEQQIDALNLEKLKTAKSNESEEQIRCPDCRELIRFDARKCKHCGSLIAPADKLTVNYSPSVVSMATLVMEKKASFDTHKKLLTEVNLTLKQSGLVSPVYEIHGAETFVRLASESEFNAWVRDRVATRVLTSEKIEVTL